MTNITTSFQDYSSTTSFCTISVSAQRTTTIATSTSTYTFHRTEPTVQISRYRSITVNITDAAFSCAEYLDCHLIIQPIPDIAGIGVIAAFLATACTTFALMSILYFFNFLPGDYLNRIDRRILRRHSANTTSAWRERLEDIVIIFSDQQLITGLSILIAGFWQAANYNLDYYHWIYIIYLAWLSSTVHLMSISMLRHRFKENKVLRNIRLGIMLIIIGLLCAALSVTVPALHQPSLPVHCLLRPSKFGPEIDRIYQSKWNYSRFNITKIDANSIISYITLIGLFAWKIVNLFASSRSWLRRWFRTRLECQMELSIQKLVRVQRSNIIHRICFRTLAIIYILFVVLMDVIESFVISIFVVAFTLTWGAQRLLWQWKFGAFEDRELSKMTFGQVLPLLFLLQPALAAIGSLTIKKESDGAISTLLPPIESSRILPPSHNTLSELLRDTSVQLLTADEKLDRQRQDPVIEQIYESRTLRVIAGLLLMGNLAFLALLATFNVVGGSYAFGGKDLASLIVSALELGSGPSILFLVFCLAWSKRLVKY